MSFKFSDDNKRYHTLNFYNKQKYGGKVYKAAINAGLSCPNIDGKLGIGGCHVSWRAELAKIIVAKQR